MRTHVAAVLSLAALSLTAIAPGPIAAETPAAGTPLTVMSFNIWQGGKLGSSHPHGFGEQNLAQLREFVRAQNPDVLFTVETYGSGPAITEALNRDQPDREYTGTRITDEPGKGDNLWLFTHLPVQKVHRETGVGSPNSFHFGGAQLGLPDGTHFHAFSTWLHHTGPAISRLLHSAMEVAYRVSRTYTDQELLDTDNEQRVRMARAIVDDRLPGFVGDDPAPVVIGGDLNAMSNVDWSAENVNAPGHEGLALDWPAVRTFGEAGFTDSYREANPSVAEHPGTSFGVAFGKGHAPTRVDYILTRGAVRTTSSTVHTQRMSQHQGGEMDRVYPFYSDHGALVSELVIGANGRGPSAGRPEPRVPADVPPPPAGTVVPVEELSATASSEHPEHPASDAVDGDVRTHWYSDDTGTPPDPQPHTLTLDMSTRRDLTAVRYLPRIDGFLGMVVDYTLEISEDGRNFQRIASGSWARDQLPKNLTLSGTGRYLRLTVGLGAGQVSAVGELKPYE